MTATSTAGTTAGAEPAGGGQPEAPAGRAGALRRLAGWIPAVVVVAATAATLLATGTPLADIARYALYLVGAVVLPGTLVYRAVRGEPRTVVEDLAVGAATGFALELVAWAFYGVLGLQGWLWTWPLVVVVVFAAVPRLRRHFWPSGYSPVPAGFAWGLAAVALVVVAYLWISYLALQPVLPTGPHPYYQDLLYHLSLSAEAKHHFPLQVPQVAGEPLQYHWFADAHVASASLISGADLPTVFFRLYLTPISVLSAVLLAVAGWRISGRPYVGVVAAALVFAVGELNFAPGSGTFGTVFAFTAWASPSMTYSYLFLFPLAFLIANRLAYRPGTRGEWALIGLFLVASAGAKSSTIPVLLAGAGVALAGAALRRRILWPAVAAVGAMIAVQLTASAVLLGGQAYGLSIHPLRMISTLPTAVAALAPERAAWQDLVLAAAVAAIWAAVLFTRLAGIPVLLYRRRWRPDAVELFLLGGFVASLAAALIFDHPGRSQGYFLKAGWPLGAILSAWGFVELVEARRPPRWLAYLGAGVLAVGTVALTVAAPRLWPPVRAVGAAAVTAAARPLLALAGVALVGAVAWFLLRWRVPAVRGAGVVVALAALLAVGAANLPIELRPAVQGLVNGTLPPTVPTGVSGSMVGAAQWVRNHSDPDDIVATNVHCQNRTPDGRLTRGTCDSRAYWVSGFTERRVLVESWAYTNQNIGATPTPGRNYAEQPFWDQDLLAANDAAFNDPSPERLAVLRDQHDVRWLVADRRAGFSPRLESLATLRYRTTDAEVYELQPAR